MATLLNSRTIVFGQSSEGNSMFCHSGTARKTMYALDRPANSMMIAVSRIQTPTWPFEIGNDGPNAPEPPSPGLPGWAGGGTIPVRPGSVNTGIFLQSPESMLRNGW